MQTKAQKSQNKIKTEAFDKGNSGEVNCGIGYQIGGRFDLLFLDNIRDSDNSRSTVGIGQKLGFGSRTKAKFAGGSKKRGRRRGSPKRIKERLVFFMRSGGSAVERKRLGEFGSRES